MTSICGKCEKTVYPVEKIECGRTYHKGCFRCQECDIGLTLKSVQVNEGKIYCGQHVPKHKLTSVADSMSTQHAINAPKKSSEGLHKIQVGTGEAGNVGIDSMSNQLAINAPKKSSEGIGKTYATTSDSISKDSEAFDNPVQEDECEDEQEDEY